MTLVRAMPAVREDTGEQPVQLERVEVRPGVVLKLSPADKAAYAAAQKQAAADRAAWEKAVVGEPVEAEAQADADTGAPDVDAAPRARSKRTKQA